MSPDEFTGGPVELFTFAEDAAANPTFYADITNPQSLNKYQYVYNSPLRYNDPTGHCPVVPALCPVIPVIPAIPRIAPRVAPYVGPVIAAIGTVILSTGDNTTGDPSCPACGRSQKMGQALMENSNSEGGAEGSSQSNQGNRGSRNPNTAEAAKEGREQHKDFAEKVKAKEGWQSEPTLEDPKTGKNVRPDAVSPGGRPVELKPKTPSGRAKGRKQLPGQERATGKRGRVVYYEPKRKKPEPQ